MTEMMQAAAAETNGQHRRRLALDRLAEHIAVRLSGPDAALLAQFARTYYAGAPVSDIEALDVVDLYGGALSHWMLGQGRVPGTAAVRAITPQVDSAGWRSEHTVVEVVVDEMPFVVDSVSSALLAGGLGVYSVLYSTIAVTRDSAGLATGFVADAAQGSGATMELFVRIEVDRTSEPERLRQIESSLAMVLEEVRSAVSGWSAMREQVATAAQALSGEPRALVEWLVDDHFTLLGVARFERAEGAATRPIPASATGILQRAERLEGIDALPIEGFPPVYVTKGRQRSLVSRPVRLDEVWIARFDAAGGINGWDLLVGLLGAETYTGSVDDVPLVWGKVEEVLQRSGLAPGSHGHSRLLTVLAQYPRDEVLQAPVSMLAEHAAAIAALRDVRHVQVLAREDDRGRYHSVLIYLPRDQYTTELRLRIQSILSEEFATDDFEHTALVSESPHARLHYVLHHAAPVASPSLAALEDRIRLVARDWETALRLELVEVHGEERGLAEFVAFGGAFSRGYREQYSVRTAVTDIAQMAGLPAGAGMGVQLRQRPEDAFGVRRFKFYVTGEEVSLSRVMPILQNLGVEVLDERPHRVEPAGREAVWIYDFMLRLPATAAADTSKDARDRFEEAFSAVWRGEADDDALNRLTVLAGLRVRQVMLIRTLVRYLRQIGLRFSDEYIGEMLVEHTSITAGLVRLFEGRHDPERAAPSLAIVEEVRGGIGAVESLEQDRLLRALLSVVMATARTNYFQTDAEGRPRDTIALKLATGMIPFAPEPRPLYEVFAFGSRMEGVHLRAGMVGRGGIRWSERREDFRTEILELMHTQTAKNAVIVPTGAKGGFIVRRPPADRPALLQEGIACYSMLMRAMLDVTDNLIGGRIVPPARTVCYDGDDPYIVVAADKGTATFSDIANGIALERGFWLGDAFASGGSVGYDHKAMGITAKGAWESVKRHFREIGIDVASAPFTAVGIGDMSGDVFGNGMLLSRSVRLLAAFDHRHIFVDPSPDPQRSFAERERLFALPGSSWADYDRALISAGGEVFARNAKSVRLSPEAQHALGVATEEMTPDALIAAILRAPVDLLWNGGIGTFVKASTETHADAADRTSDGIRVDASDLRCRVVGEGGNLGFTQAARTEYALAGGRIYADFIDNSAGVDTSDHEVNIKIVLDGAVAHGDLTGKQRVELLAAMTDEIAGAVIQDNYDQTGALANAFAQAHLMVDVHQRQLGRLEAQVGLNRSLENLPTDDVLAERRAIGKGLQLPELSVLLAYTKIFIRDMLIASDLPDDPWFGGELAQYFPTLLRERFADQVGSHPLRRELIAAQATNHIVSRAGTSMVHRMADETSAAVADIVRAHYVAWNTFDMATLWDEIAALDLRVPADVQTQMFLECRRLAERSTRWFLRNRRSPLEIGPTVEAFRATASAVAEALPRLLGGAALEERDQQVEALAGHGVPPETASRVAGLRDIVAVLDIVDAAARTGASPAQVAETYFLLETRLGFAWLLDRINALPRDDRWQSLARSALRDDLLAELARVTSDMVAARLPGESSDALFERWASHNAEARARAQHVLDAVRGLGTVGLAPLNVALREVRNLLHQASLPSVTVTADAAGFEVPAEVVEAQGERSAAG